MICFIIQKYLFNYERHVVLRLEFFFYPFLTLKQGRAVWSVFNKIQIKKIKDIDPPYLDIFFSNSSINRIIKL